MTITRAYTRHYRDNGQLTAYVEFSSKQTACGRTEGPARRYHGVVIPCGEHMGALFDRALRDGIVITHEVWG